MSLPRDRTAAGIALFGSIVLHLCAFFGAVGLLVAAAVHAGDPPVEEASTYTVVLSPELFAKEQPPPPEVDKPDQYVDTSSAPEAKDPEDGRFISDRNTAATSEIAPSDEGDLDTPAMEGEKLEHLELADSDHSDGEEEPPPPIEVVEVTEPVEEEAEIQPEVAAAAPMSEELRDLVEDAVEKLPLPAPELEPTDDPVEEEPAEPEVVDVEPVEAAPATAEVAETSPVVEPDLFKRSTRQTQTDGGAEEGDRASVAAADSPMGRYMKKVTSAVERRWHIKREQYAEFVSYGNLRVRFYVLPDGTTEDIEIVEQDANAVMAEFTIAAILEADAPPMPDGLPKELPEGRLEITYDVIVY